MKSWHESTTCSKTWGECLVGNWNQKCPQSNFFSNDLFNSMWHSPAFLSNQQKEYKLGLYIQEPKNLQCNIELATPRHACTAALESDMDFGNLSFRDQSTVALPSCSKTPPFQGLRRNAVLKSLFMAISLISRGSLTMIRTCVSKIQGTTGTTPQALQMQLMHWIEPNPP